MQMTSIYISSVFFFGMLFDIPIQAFFWESFVVVLVPNVYSELPILEKTRFDREWSLMERIQLIQNIDQIKSLLHN